MGNRIETLRDYLAKLLDEEGRKRSRFIENHLFAVSNFAAMIAMKRGLDPEIATMAGLLHDIYTALTGNSEKHAKLGAKLARDILAKLDIATPDEADVICSAIKHHSKKSSVHDPYSELVKDADVLSHYFYNVSYPVFEKDRERLKALAAEFGFGTGGI